MKKKAKEIIITNQDIFISDCAFKGNVIFKYKGERIPNQFLQRVWLAIRIIFKRVPYIFNNVVIMQDNYFFDSKVKTNK